MPAYRLSYIDRTTGQPVTQELYAVSPIRPRRALVDTARQHTDVRLTWSSTNGPTTTQHTERITASGDHIAETYSITPGGPR